MEDNIKELRDICIAYIVKYNPIRKKLYKEHNEFHDFKKTLSKKEYEERNSEFIQLEVNAEAMVYGCLKILMVLNYIDGDKRYLEKLFNKKWKQFEEGLY